MSIVASLHPTRIIIKGIVLLNAAVVKNLYLFLSNVCNVPRFIRIVIIAQ